MFLESKKFRVNALHDEIRAQSVQQIILSMEISSKWALDQKK